MDKNKSKKKPALCTPVSQQCHESQHCSLAGHTQTRPSFAPEETWLQHTCRKGWSKKRSHSSRRINWRHQWAAWLPLWNMAWIYGLYSLPPLSCCQICRGSLKAGCANVPGWGTPCYYWISLRWRQLALRKGRQVKDPALSGSGHSQSHTHTHTHTRSWSFFAETQMLTEMWRTHAQAHNQCQQCLFLTMANLLVKCMPCLVSSA